jgi:hypothetical protein
MLVRAWAYSTQIPCRAAGYSPRSVNMTVVSGSIISIALPAAIA